MIHDELNVARKLKQEILHTDLAVVGGGLSGVCAAITAARQGIKVVLVQDRPVLGGNASSEVRLWVLGATSHMGNNNRWAREGGVIDELLVENTYRNPEGNAMIFDSILLDKVKCESNITLLLNTAVYEVSKSSEDKIESVVGFCSQNSTEYVVKAPLFCDASGDGIVGFLAGAAFRMGAESTAEFGELFAPTKEYGELLGHSLYFFSKDVGKPVNYVPPSFALQNITEIPRYKSFNTKDYGCRLWWLEYGGRLDTVHDTEAIKWELWKVVYGVWNYIKNSGNFPDAANLTLEWVGMIPGKRESRRFEGDYIMIQQDIVEQKAFDDAVAFGGWSIDLHPADGLFSEKPGCNQWHSKGIYQIPYRSLYSKNISNLFLAGRIISVSHVAFASTRVMATAAYVAQVVGVAAKICLEKGLNPRDILTNNLIGELQTGLQISGQHIPHFELKDSSDLVHSATITASSELEIIHLPESEIKKPLINSVAQLIPIEKGAQIPAISFVVYADEDTTLEVELRISIKAYNYTPDMTLEIKSIPLKKGKNDLTVQFKSVLKDTTYAFFTILKNEKVQLCYTNQRITGLLTVFNQINKAVSNYGKQTPPAEIGMDTFEFWCPQRRPEGHNLALKLSSPLNVFSAANISNGIDRPTTQPNAWVANFADTTPALTIQWKEKQTISRIDLVFDADYDHPMESVLMGHPENVMPFVIRDYKIKDGEGNIIYSKKDNYQTINTIVLPVSITTSSLVIEVNHPSATTPAAIFAVRAF